MLKGRLRLYNIQNRYYAYGLRIATLSSKKLGDSYEGTLKNGYLYNGKELFDDADLNWYDYGFRNYDPQIGRFPQLDPLTHEYPFLTPYQYASCDPITNIDVDGLEGCPSVGGMTGYVGNVGRAAGGGAGGIFNGISAVARVIGPVASIANLAVNVINTASQQSIVKQQLATNSINGRFTTGQTGDGGHGPNTGNSLNNSEGGFDANEPKTYWPLYKSADAAAVGFAKYISNNNEADKYEYSSVIYQIKTKEGENYYSFTRPVRFPDDDVAENNSPGPDEIINERKLLPKGDYTLYDIGFIHNHPYGDNQTANLDFSQKDMNLYKKGRVLWLLNINGALERWSQMNLREILLGTGFETNPSNPKLTSDFNDGGSQDLNHVDYYKIIKQ